MKTSGFVSQRAIRTRVPFMLARAPAAPMASATLPGGRVRHREGLLGLREELDELLHGVPVDGGDRGVAIAESGAARAENVAQPVTPVFRLDPLGRVQQPLRLDLHVRASPGPSPGA